MFPELRFKVVVLVVGGGTKARLQRNITRSEEEDLRGPTATEQLRNLLSYLSP